MLSGNELDNLLTFGFENVAILLKEKQEFIPFACITLLDYSIQTVIVDEDLESSTNEVDFLKENISESLSNSEIYSGVVIYMASVSKVDGVIFEVIGVESQGWIKLFLKVVYKGTDLIFGEEYELIEN